MARSQGVSRCFAEVLALACLACPAALAGAGPTGGPLLAQLPAAGTPAASHALPEAAEAAPPVERVRLLRRGGGRLDWSVQGDLIAFDQRGADGFYDLYVMSPDGRGERCLTCAHPEFRQAHALNPAWHPSGQALVFQVQERAAKLAVSAAGLTSPDRGLHCELWVISRDGRRPWRLTRVGDRGGAVLDPAFSHEGDRLAWSERVGTAAGRWGEWVVRVGRFRLQGGVPRLSGVKTLRPGGDRGLALVSSFTPDDRQLLVAATGAGAAPDLYRLEEESGRLTPVLVTPGEWDEQARPSPGGEHLAWTSSRGLAPAPRLGQLGGAATARPVPRELWLMLRDGTEPRRLTSFAAADGSGHGSGAVVSDLAWRPDGGALAVHVLTDLATGEEGIFLVELAAGLGR